MNSCATISGPARRTAFTLVELLVVIVILGILAALLLPALARAKESARKVSCLNRLRQWNQALLSYAHDNEGAFPRESFFPSDVIRNQWIHVRNPLAHDVWYNALPPEIEERGAVSFAPTPARSDFYERNRLIQCPSAKFPTKPGADVWTYFSYAMNSKLALGQSAATVKLGAIQNTSATVTFLDNRLEPEPKVDPLQDDTHLGQPSAYASRFVTRHLQRGPLAFADGHVDFFLGRDVVTNGKAIMPQRKIIWTTDPKLDPN